MIRRFYVLPLDQGTSDQQSRAFVTALTKTDEFISGLTDSFAAVDMNSHTIVWEVMIRDEETYTGPYMVHPYHVATLDNYLLADSPERLAHDFATMRYVVPEGTPRMEQGVRRVLLMNLGDDSDTSPLDELAVQADGMTMSVFSTDEVAWRSSKASRGLTWTHVWEQGFDTPTSLSEYLATPDGVASSTRDGLRRLGMDVQSLLVLTYPFTLKQGVVEPSVRTDDGPSLYTVTARVAVEDVERYITLLEGEYDVALATAGAKLLHRWQTLEDAYLESEVQSTWQFDSMTAFKDFRTGMSSDPSWNRFVLQGMPLVRGGTRRFHRAR